PRTASLVSKSPAPVPDAENHTTLPSCPSKLQLHRRFHGHRLNHARYDALHRLTYVNYPSGQYASVTPSKYYIYDSATINGTAMANPKNRLAEAYTCTSCSPATKITDLGFSYSVRGEVTDTYEWTTNSGGWYHVSGSYWANGALNQLSTNLSGLPTITYGADGEGRVSTVGASSGQNPVSATSYNYASQVTNVTLGSGDSDQYTYDSNTDRMTQYKFAIGATPQNVIGNLGWNPNGSLGSLTITDPFNAANDQTCNYTHDDLSRLATANCGSIWNQSFGFDPFGNISKTGTQSFTPTYSNLTNQINGGGYSQSYDANGNLKTINDGTNHTYSWDAEGKQIGIDTVTASYDALGRMVEVNNSGTFTQTVYGLGSEKLALMNGQTMQKSFVALPSGTAVYTASGLTYYRHSDWLGSSRFASTTSQTMYSSSAYAPYGEQYAGAGSNDQNFTGQQQDTTSGLYDFMFRRLGQIQGRWISPDPGGLGVVNPANPQTWNRYAYVSNNPMSFTDPYGLQMGYTCPQDQTGEDGTGCESGGGGGGGGGGFCDASGDCGAGTGVDGWGNTGVSGVPWNWQPGYAGVLMSPLGLIHSAELQYLMSTPAFYIDITTYYANGNVGQSINLFEGYDSYGLAPIAFTQSYTIDLTGPSNYGNATKNGRTPGTNGQQHSATPQPEHFWQKPGCSEALGGLAVGAVGTAITVGAIVASFYLGPELYEGVEGLGTIAHIGPIGAPGLVLLGQSGFMVADKCF
ncbi:MAG: RHS repeat-associated core domain-containing protein, partial [Terriglobia bacterium]|nr:RHS repeat-associated core domain-containing protein [Terriglobia bacterium]